MTLQDEAEIIRLRARVAELEAVTDRVVAERTRLLLAVRGLMEGIDDAGPYADVRALRDGNAPGHAHRVRGHWDSDGRPCEWCARWDHARSLVGL